MDEVARGGSSDEGREASDGGGHQAYGAAAAVEGIRAVAGSGSSVCCRGEGHAEGTAAHGAQAAREGVYDVVRVGNGVCKAVDVAGRIGASHVASWLM